MKNIGYSDPPRVCRFTRFVGSLLLLAGLGAIFGWVIPTQDDLAAEPDEKDRPFAQVARWPRLARLVARLLARQHPIGVRHGLWGRVAHESEKRTSDCDSPRPNEFGAVAGILRGRSGRWPSRDSGRSFDSLTRHRARNCSHCRPLPRMKPRASLFLAMASTWPRAEFRESSHSGRGTTGDHWASCTAVAGE